MILHVENTPLVSFKPSSLPGPEPRGGLRVEEGPGGLLHEPQGHGPRVGARGHRESPREAHEGPRPEHRKPISSTLNSRS